jgi:hypothetical protein
VRVSELRQRGRRLAEGRRAYVSCVVRVLSNVVIEEKRECRSRKPLGMKSRSARIDDEGKGTVRTEKR